MSAEVQPRPAKAERQWWVRLVRVLTAPTSVFVWVRDDSEDAAAARQEPLTAVVFLSGISIFLSTRTAGRLFDDIEFDWLLVAVEALIAGLLVGVQNFWIMGGAVYLGGRAAESAGSYRQARHLTALATMPFVLALVFVWPVRLAMFGADAFRSGGSDHGAAEAVFRAIDVGFLAWTAALLLIGVRTLNGWTWARSLAGLAVAGAVFTLFALLFLVF
ncbi:MAG: Yip1 family protein [Verrucomicrobiota bacterium]